MCVHLRPEELTPIQLSIPCHLDKSEDLQLCIRGDVVGPSIIFEEAALEFGVVEVGTEVTAILTLVNNTLDTVHWMLGERLQCSQLRGRFVSVCLSVCLSPQLSMCVCLRVYIRLAC